jgi:phosphoglycolate phosphatase-like HAD superfamily hydrolase
MEGIFLGIYGFQTHKSKVEKFKLIFENFRLKKEECVFVTDTLGDIIEGNHVGIKTLAVDNGYHERERLEKGKPFMIVSSLDEIERILKEDF